MTLLMTLLIASTGFDLLSVNPFGATLRVSYIAYFLAFLLFRKQIKFGRTQTLYFAMFVGLSALGIFWSASVIKSIFYLVWAIFSYIVVFGLFSFFAREKREELYRALVLSFRLQILCGLLLFLVQAQDRVHLLYYEPSYFAIALAVYAAIAFCRFIRQGLRSAAVDLLLLLIAVVTTKSATLLLCLAIVYGAGSLLIGFHWKKIVALIAVAGLALLASYCYALYGHDLVAMTLAQLYNSSDPLLSLTGRGGNRFPRLAAAWDIFQEHPWLGVGIGAYEDYTSTLDLSSYSNGIPWLSPENKPAVNIYVELLVTTGIPATLAFVIFLLRTVSLRRPGELDMRQLSYLLAVIAMLLTLNFEANYLRPYLWMILGIYSGSIPFRRVVNAPGPSTDDGDG